MKNRFVRIGSFALMLVMLLGCCSFTAYAAGYSSSGNSFTLLNMSGIAITEVYFYPSYNSSWGKIRNTSWIYNGREAKVSFTSAEMRLNTEWCIRIGFNKGRYVSYALWEGISPSELVNAQYVTVISNDQGGYTLDYGGGNANVGDNAFTLLNMTGSAITEVYFYPSSNSIWGKIRNSNWIYNGDEATMRFDYNELGLDVEWCMRLGINMGRYVSYVCWEGLSLEDFVNCDYILVTSEGNSYTICFEYDDVY
ncbi:MAG: hypothetical protein IIW08_11455 [Clostridia bacterium]|nr:hypothetical protein [Clostridia bacterium]